MPKLILAVLMMFVAGTTGMQTLIDKSQTNGGTVLVKK